ncbi:MAG: radical SAM family heme chaperone HemW [Treponema sp.]|nr:radical SAM family heme chaperone HemW [Treponema sp.]
MIASLYIHIPFCSSLCDYCDFYSIDINSIKENNLKNEYFDSYLKALVLDIREQIEYFKIEEIPTAYIGGGTPSVLDSKIKYLLNELNKISCFNPVEFTIEANTESVANDFLDICKDGGINRISLGVQTFNEKSRLAVNRGRSEHREEKKVKKSLKIASSYFPDSLCVDLITGLPFQDNAAVFNDINKILEFNPSHISLYSLTVDPETPLAKKINLNTILLPQNEIAEELWLTGRELLITKGFENYEISNFAKDNKYSRHNLRYWRLENWIGAGAAASGTIINDSIPQGKRYAYNSNIDEYIKNPNIQNANCEILDKLTLIKESLLMGYRCSDGPDLTLFKNRFSCSIEECIGETLFRWQNKNKMLYLNRFLEEAFVELERRMI